MVTKMACMFEINSLDAHNKWRLKHNVGPLRLNRDLTKKAQEWANYLICNDVFEHNPDRRYMGQTVGENIAYMYDSLGADLTGPKAAEVWHSEMYSYDFSTNTSTAGQVGHFTQLVWKGTKEMGTARATNSKGKWIAVAYYLPAGNVVGSFAQNVFPQDEPMTGERLYLAGRSSFPYNLVPPDEPYGGQKGLREQQGFFSSCCGGTCQHSSHNLNNNVTNNNAVGSEMQDGFGKFREQKDAGSKRVANNNTMVTSTTASGKQLNGTHGYTDESYLRLFTTMQY